MGKPKKILDRINTLQLKRIEANEYKIKWISITYEEQSEKKENQIKNNSKININNVRTFKIEFWSNLKVTIKSEKLDKEYSKLVNCWIEITEI